MALKKTTEEKRTDPGDNKAYTFAELSAFYAGTYTKKVVLAYWNDTCKAVPAKGKGKGKAKAEAEPKAKAKAKAKVKAKAKAKNIEERKPANPEDVLKKVAECKVIPVVSIDDVAHALPLCNALVAGGIKIIEICYRTDLALEAMKEAVKCEDICVGAGTVLNAKQAADALDIGADFIVSPGFDIPTAKLCKRRGALYLPGTVTPTEVMTASSVFKLKNLKFFPAGNYGGVGTLKSFAAVFPDIKFMPTGGVSVDNVAEFTSLPNVVACGGSWITKDIAKCAASGDWSLISEVSKKARSAAGCS